MSDTGRKDLTSKITEAIIPDSSKSQSQKTKEGATDIMDKGVRGLGGDSQKSTTQEAADKAGRVKDSNSEGGTSGSILDSAKKMVGMDNK